MITALQILARREMLAPVATWYVFYCLSAMVAACFYWVIWRLAIPARGARLFAVAAALEALSALVALAAIVTPGLLDLLTFPGALGIAGLFDVLTIVSVGISIVALLTTRLAPVWVTLLRVGVLVFMLGQDAYLVVAAGPTELPAWTTYTGTILSIAFWVSFSAHLLKQSHAEEHAGRSLAVEASADSDPSANVQITSRAGQTIGPTLIHMVVVVLVMLLLLANFAPLVLGTVLVFHGFNFDLFLNFAVAAVAYGALWAVGASLDRKYRAVAAASYEDASGRPSVPQELTDAYGLMLVCLLPFLFYLFIFSLYAVELLITQALVLMNAMQGMPIVVIVGLLFVAGGSIWGVALGFWRLLVAPAFREYKVELSRAENLALWEVVDDVARDSGTRTVDRMWVASNAEIAVWEEGGLGRVLSGRAPRCMVIGLTAVHDMRVDELRSILRHEFAHFSNRDTAWGSFTYSMTRSLMAAWQATPGGNPFKAGSLLGGVICLNPAWWVYWLFVRLFTRSTAGFSRLRELIADWDAIAYSGGACFASGLTKVIVNDTTLDTWLRETQVTDGVIPSVADGVAMKLAGLTPEQLRDSTESALAGDAIDSGAYDTHPEPKLRLEYAAKAGGQHGSCSEQPVIGLLDDWVALDAQASRAWLSLSPAHAQT